MANYNPGHKTVLDAMLLDYADVQAGKMFGFPAYYVAKKLCICLYEQGVGVKLPAQTVARLLEADPNVFPFQPMNRATMREWVQINLESSEGYRQYQAVFEESITHVMAQQAQGKSGQTRNK
jgi:hypothetical protein